MSACVAEMCFALLLKRETIACSSRASTRGQGGATCALVQIPTDLPFQFFGTYFGGVRSCSLSRLCFFAAQKETLAANRNYNKRWFPNSTPSHPTLSGPRPMQANNHARKTRERTGVTSPHATSQAPGWYPRFGYYSTGVLLGCWYIVGGRGRGGVR
jgi:hypothetical protein